MQDLEPYPKWAITTLNDRVYTESDIPALRAEYGPMIAVLSRGAEGLHAMYAPIEIIKFGILGRCVKAVPAQLLEETPAVSSAAPIEKLPESALAELPEPPAPKKLPELDEPATVLICAPPFDEAMTHSLIEMIVAEVQFFATKLQQAKALDACLAMESDPGRSKIESIITESVRRLSAETKVFHETARQIILPTGEWTVYDPVDATVVADDDTIAAKIRAFATRSLRANFPLPIAPAEELAAMRCLYDLAPPETASAFARAMVAHPALARAIFMPDFEAFLQKAEFTDADFEPAISLLLAEEISHTSSRLRTPAATPRTFETPDEVLARLGMHRRRDGAVVRGYGYNIEVDGCARAEAKTIEDTIKKYYDYCDEGGISGYDHDPNDAKTWASRFKELFQSLEQMGVFPCRYTSYGGQRYSTWTTDPEESVMYKVAVQRESAAENVPPDLSSPQPGSSTLPWLFNSHQLVQLKARYGPVSVKDAFDRLNIYVGGYLANLDLSRTMITGSAIAAALIRAEKSPAMLMRKDAEDPDPHAQYKAYLASHYPVVYTEPVDAEDLDHYRQFALDEFRAHPSDWAVAGNRLKIVDHKGDPILLNIVPGADVDMAIAATSDAEFDAEVQKHYTAILRTHPQFVLTRVDRPDATHSWKIAHVGGHHPTYRAVELYRATFDHIVTHHVGMVSGAYTCRQVGAAPEFVVSARLVHSMLHLSSPNYYYFASRKAAPQEIVLKYYARGFSLDGFPSGLARAIKNWARTCPKWCKIVTGFACERDALRYPAMYGAGNFSAFSLQAEYAALDRGRPRDKRRAVRRTG